MLICFFFLRYPSIFPISLVPAKEKKYSPPLTLSFPKWETLCCLIARIVKRTVSGVGACIVGLDISSLSGGAPCPPGRKTHL